MLFKNRLALPLFFMNFPLKCVVLYWPHSCQAAQSFRTASSSVPSPTCWSTIRPPDTAYLLRICWIKWAISQDKTKGNIIPKFYRFDIAFSLSRFKRVFPIFTWRNFTVSFKQLKEVWKWAKAWPETCIRDRKTVCQHTFSMPQTKSCQHINIRFSRNLCE